MHREPNAHDAPAPDPDATGHDGRAHYAPPAPRTAYQVWHHDHPVSPEYGSMMEAGLYRVFETPGTDDYAIRAVRATESTTDRRTPDRHPPRIL